jgi:hypothetical protein
MADGQMELLVQLPDLRRTEDRRLWCLCEVPSKTLRMDAQKLFKGARKARIKRDDGQASTFQLHGGICSYVQGSDWANVFQDHGR